MMETCCFCISFWCRWLLPCCQIWSSSHCFALNVMCVCNIFNKTHLFIVKRQKTWLSHFGFCLYDTEIPDWSCLKSSVFAVDEQRIVWSVYEVWWSIAWSRSASGWCLGVWCGEKGIIGMAELPGTKDHILQPGTDWTLQRDGRRHPRVRGDSMSQRPIALP